MESLAVKKPYQKPAVLKREALAAVTAIKPVSGVQNQT
ncbi:hypothetical protein C8P69_102424 [Phreatobacter oligotrophus]|jgi:hypothetical protein|uniref:Uncharacterized protein n=1 Tax=Phreatobacter oligotrophus TaxID=1122261 RepID=A0A2T4ZGI7_9HYPH|nr:hypothetical protein C8P69_102424 [Phreatobacter oligotrophus]